jgi:tetratricopeptide (TPR) repeat protein
MNNLLEQGIAAAQAGQRDEARALLIRAVEADERNEQAWLWLAGLVDDPNDMRTCLENVLDLNPGNVKARQGLEWIEKRYGPPVAAAQAESQPAKRVSTAPATQGAAAYGPPSTGPTTRLEPPSLGGAAALPAQPPQQQAAPAPLPTPMAAPEYPCPYCAAATAPNDKRCPQCRANLMVRAEGFEKRSKALTILGWLWGINGALALIGTALALFLLSRGLPGLPKTALPQLQRQAIIGIVSGLIYLVIARGLLRRRRWAYILTAALATLNFMATVCFVLLFTVGLRLGVTAASGLPRPGAGLVSIISGLIIGVVLIFQFLYLLLIVLSYRDVFAPLERLYLSVGTARHKEHFNNGIAYRDHGMWFMAAQEWEAAVKQAPRESTYLHALGLAYGQLKRIDQARMALDAAIQAAPDNQQIKESRTALDKMAARAPR